MFARWGRSGRRGAQGCGGPLTRGRADLTLRFGGKVYVFEFNVTKLAGAGSALSQLKARGYADKYRGRGAPIHLIGIEFSRETRTLAAFDVASA